MPSIFEIRQGEEAITLAACSSELNAKIYLSAMPKVDSEDYYFYEVKLDPYVDRLRDGWRNYEVAASLDGSGVVEIRAIDFDWPTHVARHGNPSRPGQVFLWLRFWAKGESAAGEIATTLRAWHLSGTELARLKLFLDSHEGMIELKYLSAQVG